jgi:hypothetical protein
MAKLGMAYGRLGVKRKEGFSDVNGVQLGGWGFITKACRVLVRDERQGVENVTGIMTGIMTRISGEDDDRGKGGF